MEVYPYHVFVCDQQKPEGVPCCCARGSAAVIEELRAQVGRQGLADKVQITVCGSLGLCERGPNMVVYPAGIWYSGVQPGDVAEIVSSHFGKGKPVQRLMNQDRSALQAEMTLNRTRHLNAMREKDASGALPEELEAIIRGFQDSRAILTAIELDVFTAVGGGATAAEVARGIQADPRATEMLLHALVPLQLLRKRDGAFENTPASARYLAAGGKDDSRAALMHSVHLWHRWSTLTDAVRAGTAVRTEEAAGRAEGWTEAFIAAMHRNATERAGLVVAAVGADRVRRMLDVGGGSAAYSIAFAKANPELRAEVFDLAPVTSIAGRHIAAAGLGERVTTRVGDLTRDALGTGYDLVFVSAICHMLSPEENVSLLRRAGDAVVRGGRVVIQDFILEPDKTGPKFGTLFALNMLVGTKAGSSYSEPEYRQWLETAGFRDVQRTRLPGPTGLMIAVR